MGCRLWDLRPNLKSSLPVFLHLVIHESEFVFSYFLYSVTSSQFVFNYFLELCSPTYLVVFSYFVNRIVFQDINLFC